MSFAICPSCGDEIRLRSQPGVGQQVLCPYCGAELEVIALDPVELDWVYYDEDFEEEWDDAQEPNYH